MTTAEPGLPEGRRPRVNGTILAMLAVVIVAGVVVASIGFGMMPSLVASTSSSETVTLPSDSSATRTSGGPLVLCSGLTPAQELSNAKVLNGSWAGTPNYDEQLLMGFEQNFTSGISYNVTVRAQNDSSGFGPAYLLNGLTDAGYWYQTGVAWNLPTGSGSNFAQGFRFVYEVWDTNTSATVFPRAGGTIVQRFTAEDGDVVQLSLNMTSAGLVSMSAHDWNTSAKAAASFSAFGASQFLGFKDKVSSYPTSLLTEWYHTLPYFCSEEPVVYSNASVALTSAWLRIDEWNLTGVSASQRFNSSDSGQCCVFSTGSQGIGFEEPETFRSLSTNGTSIYANAHQFVTP